MTSIDNIKDTSTPKRRRMGTGRIFRSSLQKNKPNNDLLMGFSPVMIPKHSQAENSTTDRCDSPLLPCNQVEFRSICDSENNSSICDIPCSPDVLPASIENEWESLNICTSNINEIDEISKTEDRNNQALPELIEEISDDMFQSKLEQSHIKEIDKKFTDNIEKSFDMVNQSISNFDEVMKSKSLLFETRDSFLLDVKEDPTQNIPNQNIKNNDVKLDNTFYGLPMIAKGLFKTYRNIEKFYEWQEECLNLEAVRERRNLIYALPTSGGKTLVAEVLMLREVLNRKKNALFILPFVAIVQEKVDELHLIGESGRGGTLETLLTTVIFTNKDIQIVGMSATIGNLHEIAQFLRADVFQREFRPVELTEYVKLGDMLHKIVWGPEGVEIVPDRALSYNYSAAATSLDPDLIGGLVSEVVPRGSVLVFCPTKRNCENVTTLLCKLQRRFKDFFNDFSEMVSHKAAERQALESALRAEGANSDLAQAVRYGIAYHHAGLASDERSLLEQAYRAGTISVLCCTSTLAAGVNLPAQRVIIRAPLVGRDFLTLGAYRQMVGRAGRAGVCDMGESIVICGASVWPKLQTVLRGGLAAARSALRRGAQGPGCLPGLLLSGAALRLACTRARMREFLACTLLAVTGDDSCSPSDINSILDETLRSLLQSGALEVVKVDKGQGVLGEGDASHVAVQECRVYNDTELAVSALGSAAIKACMDLTVAEQFLADLDQASKSLVVMGSLHLLYLVTPQDAASIKPDYAHYYSLYSNLDEEGVQTAKVLGITEQNAIRMMTGKPIKSVLGAATSAAVSGARLCGALGARWLPAALLAELAPRLQHAAAPELSMLMDLPNVKKIDSTPLLVDEGCPLSDINRFGLVQFRVILNIL
ncbi:hypothetical protein HF086_009731 [Spodoptera exigua]|uniref:Helicase C-terminal domain-containing protein n=1 Tax=Spodoptera exigua TaxID=7107 RepID=A0A922SEF9_SPOEX|nr:hypothetical protein HF086_009731 [Spodoptera exigua]